MSDTRVLVVCPDELAAGFRLGGVGTRTVADPEQAAELVGDLIGAAEAGVIAVYEPFLEQLDPELRAGFETSVDPVVVPIPDGLETHSAEQRRARLATLLQRAVGYHIVFREEGDE